MVDYTKQYGLSTSARLLLEFDIRDLQNANIKADADFFYGYDPGVTITTGYKVLSGVAIEWDKNSFTDDEREEGKQVRIYGIVASGTPTAYVQYQGRAQSW